MEVPGKRADGDRTEIYCCLLLAAGCDIYSERERCRGTRRDGGEGERERLTAQQREDGVKNDKRWN